MFENKMKIDSSDFNQKAKEFHEQKKQNYTNFHDTFTKEYKLLKKLTHECQAQCYGQDQYSNQQSESCARICLRPYMSLRKLNGEKMEQCEKIFQEAESKCLLQVKNTEMCYATIVIDHKKCLQKIEGFSRQNYIKYIDNYDKFSKEQ